MPTIRIPTDHWGKVWRFLVQTGPIGRTSKEPIYHISDRQLKLLREENLPFELLAPPNGLPRRKKHEKKKGT